jgi:transitional endoplasmic reticulum ATPase
MFVRYSLCTWPSCANQVQLKRVAVLPFADTVEGLTGNIFDVFLAPYFREAYRPLHLNDRFKVRGGMRVVEFKVVETDPPNYGIVAQDTVIHCEGEPLSREGAERDGLSYDDIGGYTAELAAVKEVLDWGLTRPKLFKRLGVSSPRGLIIQGPAGCGKTHMIRVAAAESSAVLFSVNPATTLVELQRTFQEARRNQPAIIYLDQLDFIGTNVSDSKQADQNSQLASLVAEIDDLNFNGIDGIKFVGATRHPDKVDAELDTPGRLDRRVELNRPDADARREIIQIQWKMANTESPLAQSVLEEVVALTNHYSGAQLVKLFRDAALARIRNDAEALGLDEGADTIDDYVLRDLKLRAKDLLLAAVGPQRSQTISTGR